MENKRISPTRLLVKAKGRLGRLLELVGEGSDQLVSYKQFTKLMQKLFEAVPRKRLDFEEHGDSIDIKEFLECEEQTRHAR